MYFKIPVTSSAAFNHGSFFLKHPHIGVLSKIFFLIVWKIYCKRKTKLKSHHHIHQQISVEIIIIKKFQYLCGVKGVADVLRRNKHSHNVKLSINFILFLERHLHIISEYTPANNVHLLKITSTYQKLTLTLLARLSKGLGWLPMLSNITSKIPVYYLPSQLSEEKRMQMHCMFSAYKLPLSKEKAACDEILNV